MAPSQLHQQSSAERSNHAVENVNHRFQSPYQCRGILRATVIEADWRIADVLVAADVVVKEPCLDTSMDSIVKPVWEGWAPPHSTDAYRVF
jgi:hypothetical protein